MVAKSVISKFSRLVLYFGVSGIAALVNLGSRVAYNKWVNFGWAVVCAYFTGMLVNFVLSSKFVFRSYAGGTASKVLPKFTIVATLGLAVIWAVSESSLHFFNQFVWLNPSESELFAHMMGIGTAFFASFFGHQFFTYRHTGMTAAS